MTIRVHSNLLISLSAILFLNGKESSSYYPPSLVWEMALWGLQVAIKFSYTWGYMELFLLLSICTWPHQFSSCQLFFPVSQVPQTKEVLCFLFSKTTVFQFLTIWLCGNLCFCSGSLSLQFVQYSCCCEMGWYPLQLSTVLSRKAQTSGCDSWNA